MTRPLDSRAKGSFAYGKKDPKLKPGNGIDWDKLKRQTNERLDREWDEGVRRNDTIRRRWMKTLSPERLKQEEKLLYEGKRTPLVLGVDGEPHPTTHEPQESPKSRPSRAGQYTGKTGRPRGTAHYDVDEIVRLYVEENMSPLAIVEKMGGKPAYPTVVGYLKKREVFDPNRHRTGGRRNRDSYEEQRQTHCGKCGADFSKPENVRERVRKLPDGGTRPNGRECVPCSIERKRKYDAEKRNS